MPIDSSVSRAFPRADDSRYVGQLGMTLRDYFAAAALPAILANQATLADMGKSFGDEQVASDCYIIADRMLEERAK
jgi:hypothetical protein